MRRSNEAELKANFAAYQSEEVAVNGDYLRLNADSPPETSAPVIDDYGESNWWRIGYRRSKWFWLNVIVFCAILSVIGVVVIKHYGPLFMDKEVIPLINWLSKTFSPPVLAAIVLGALALFPTLLLPTTPLKWVAGMTFGYGIGFLLILAGYAVGVSLPYLIGHHLFLQRIKRWLDKHPKHAAIVRLAGDGDWFHQFRATVLIRLAPVPFTVFNFTAAATGVKFSPYLAGSLLGLVPDTFVAIYSGILLRTVAEAMADHTPVSKFQLVLDGVGFCLTVVATIMIGFYAKRKLEQLHEQEEQQQLI
uniref:VTT domain-containing protein n=2 Tax=Opuntia streptacantha TaxID=393608 RepID=A0A7C8Z2Y0_OPUST